MTQYRYLDQRAGAGAGARSNGLLDDDANRFEQLKVALRSVGLSKRHVAQLCQLVAAILHLGILEFTVDCGRDVEAAVVCNANVVDIVSEFLAVHLESTFAYKAILVQKELCTTPMIPLTNMTTLQRPFTIFFG